MQYSTYTIGLQSTTLLENCGEVVRLTRNMQDGNQILIECNIQEETMKVELKEPFEKIDMKSIVTDQTIDLSNEGDRWVGGCFNGRPFGFGRFYDGNNILQFKGFIVDGKKECFGEVYHLDGSGVEYRGNFVNNMRHGYGCLMDRKGNVVYEGDWAFDCNESSSWIGESIDNMHNLITELRVTDVHETDFGRLVLNNYVNLKKIAIGERCFPSIVYFEINNCDNLEEVIVGKSSFSISIISDEYEGSIRDASFIIHNCQSLRRIDLEKNAFCDYGGAFKLHSTDYY